ncbi:MAG TPA: methyltransferase domain-containing protein [Candidatus Hydrogenedentes bacterium]|nr:methyltransferase domain-containing protein [Candidatus Hydrogenedentota bacterium]
MGEVVQAPESGILPLFTSVRARKMEPELMDRPDLDSRMHAHALKGLARINLLSQTGRCIWRAIRSNCQWGDAPLRILDLASGGGDVAISLARYATRERMPVEVEGCDVSAQAVAISTATAKNSGSPVRFFQRDILEAGVPSGYDVVVSTLFAHHLNEEQTIRMLRACHASGARHVIFSDLIRSQMGYLLSQFVCRAMTRSYVVRYDGPRSVAAAYTKDEFSALACKAGLSAHQIEWVWPFRFLFLWHRV